MLISPQTYVTQVENASYSEMIRERDRLIRKIRHYEKHQPDPEHPDPFVFPSPDVEYQMHLEYLSALCALMSEKYRRDRDDEDV